MPKLASGEKYLKGYVDIFPYGRVTVVAFKNKEKRTSKSPDWRVYYQTSDGKLRSLGALYVQTKKESEVVEKEEYL